MKKTAVLTDATSPEFFFPRWRRYYGGLFGFENLHVITYDGMKVLFAETSLGNIWEINAIYDDKLRARMISDMITVLLHSYDVVLRCDVDEFLFPDPARYLNLVDFVERNTRPYVTAQGLDVIELNEDQALDPERPILGAQRRFAIRTTSLNKTCLTTTPLRWAPGFHGANVYPWFSSLYNFHLKYADIRGRSAWHQKMLAGTRPDSSEQKYFSVGLQDLKNYQNFLSTRARSGGESEEEFDLRFLKTVTYNSAHQIYQGQFFSQNFIFPLEDKFNSPAADF